MRTLGFITTAFIGVLVLTPMAAAQQQPGQDVAAATAGWKAAIDENNVDKILATYAKDGVLWGTLSPTVRSDQEGLRAYFVGALKALPNLKVSFGDQLIRVYGNTAVNTGYYTFSFTRDGATASLPARYSLTYVKDGDKWLIVDHHSSAMPAPPK